MPASGDPVFVEDVVLLYERALGRPPSTAEIEHQLSHARDLRTLVRAVLESEECQARWKRTQAAELVASGEAEDTPAVVSDDASWAERFPAPERSWAEGYAEGHARLTGAAIDDPVLRAAIAGADPLPAGYAAGYDERVIEYPWLFGQGLRGRVLDAGSTLNYSHILDRALPLIDQLTILTLTPEDRAFPLRGVSYVFGDLRQLPFRDGWFDMVVSLSTLEHVGMDNAHYGAASAPAEDADREVAAAAREMRRVVRPGGRILLSVPFGRHEDHGWLRQFDATDLERLVAAFDPRQCTVSIFRHARSGWQVSSGAEAADVRYRDAFADPSTPEDLAAAARAVACVALDV